MSTFNAALSRTIWIRQPISFFTTMNLRDEDYDHVNRLLSIDNQHNLERRWVLADSSGYIHHVHYNEDLLDPRLTEGWMELRNFYRLLGDHDILIGYVGASTFQLTIFRSDTRKLTVNNYFSQLSTTEATFQGQFVHYKLTMNEYSYSNEYLVFSGEGFRNYIRDSNLTTFILCGPLEHQIFEAESSPTSDNIFYLGHR